MLTRLTRTLAAAALLTGAAFSAPSATQTANATDARVVHASFNLSDDDLALGGYDPVAYFAEGGGKPTQGSAKHVATYRGATYRFASAENRARFLAQPSRYEPAYGGWCAYAMSSDERVEVDPKSFRIEDGSLLLFYKGFLANTRKKWGKEGGDVLRPRADRNWRRFSSEARHRDVSAFHLDDGGLALGGHDPVATAQGSAAPGTVELAAVHRGVTYRFASEANRATFLADPARYEPAYGGWCAYAMAKGQRVAPDPKLSLREDDRTFLFVAAEPGLREAWRSDASLRAAADRTWAELSK